MNAQDLTPVPNYSSANYLMDLSVACLVAQHPDRAKAREELRCAFQGVAKDAARYKFLRDHFATKSANSVDDFIALEPMTGEYFDAHIDLLMAEFDRGTK